MRVARAPEERAARLAEGIEAADEREIAERLFLQRNAAGELVERAVRAVRALRDDGLRLGLAEPLHRGEPEPHVVHAARAVARDGLREVDVLVSLSEFADRVDVGA